MEDDSMTMPHYYRNRNSLDMNITIDIDLFFIVIYSVTYYYRSAPSCSIADRMEEDTRRMEATRPKPMVACDSTWQMFWREILQNGGRWPHHRNILYEVTLNDFKLGDLFKYGHILIYCFNVTCLFFRVFKYLLTFFFNTPILMYLSSDWILKT